VERSPQSCAVERKARREIAVRSRKKKSISLGLCSMKKERAGTAVLNDPGEGKKWGWKTRKAYVEKLFLGTIFACGVGKGIN